MSFDWTFSKLTIGYKVPSTIWNWDFHADEFGKSFLTQLEQVILSPSWPGLSWDVPAIGYWPVVSFTAQFSLYLHIYYMYLHTCIHTNIHTCILYIQIYMCVCAYSYIHINNAKHNMKLSYANHYHIMKCQVWKSQRQWIIACTI